MIPYSAGPFKFEAEGGVETFIVLKVPSRGTIRAIRLMQVGGAAVDATFEVFTAESCIGTSLFEEASQQVPDHPSEPLELTDDVAIFGNRAMYSVFGQKTYTGSTGLYTEYGEDTQYPYQNRDGGGPTNRKRRLYLGITPAGSAATGWEFALEIELPITI
jgi:hypothetical protein